MRSLRNTVWQTSCEGLCRVRAPYTEAAHKMGSQYYFLGWFSGSRLRSQYVPVDPSIAGPRIRNKIGRRV